MGKHQIITAPNGDELVVLPRADYEELLRIAEDAAEDAADVAVYDERIADSVGNQPMPYEISSAMLKGNSLLKSIRLWRGTSQVDLAAAIGTSQGFVSDMENRRRNVTPEIAAKLAAALDVPLHWII